MKPAASRHRAAQSMSPAMQSAIIATLSSFRHAVAQLSHASAHWLQASIQSWYLLFIFLLGSFSIIATGGQSGADSHPAGSLPARDVPWDREAGDAGIFLPTAEFGHHPLSPGSLQMAMNQGNILGSCNGLITRSSLRLLCAAPKRPRAQKRMVNPAPTPCVLSQSAVAEIYWVSVYSSPA